MHYPAHFIYFTFPPSPYLYPLSLFLHLIVLCFFFHYLTTFCSLAVFLFSHIVTNMSLSVRSVWLQWVTVSLSICRAGGSLLQLWMNIVSNVERVDVDSRQPLNTSSITPPAQCTGPAAPLWADWWPVAGSGMNMWNFSPWGQFPWPILFFKPATCSWYHLFPGTG